MSSLINPASLILGGLSSLIFSEHDEGQSCEAGQGTDFAEALGSLFVDDREAASGAAVNIDEAQHASLRSAYQSFEVLQARPQTADFAVLNPVQGASLEGMGALTKLSDPLMRSRLFANAA